MAKLVMDDIADLRAYERERAEFRAKVIALKKRRRVHVGPVVTFVFENRETIRFQIQEMARVERLITDEAIQNELDVYNPLIPAPGSVSVTLFVELTSEASLREWLPKLVGIERAVRLRIPAADGGTEEVAFAPDAGHDSQLTREEATSAVHYVHADLTPDQVERFARGPVELAIELDAYREAVELRELTVAELVADLRGSAGAT